MLKFFNVNFKYKNDSKLLIDSLNFHVNRGEFISIIGPSGCGKSTIFRLISRLEKSSDGDIYINDKNVNDIDSPIGYMPQSDLLIPWRTILENACLPLEVGGRKQKNAKKKAEEFLEAFGLDSYKDKYPKDLSGGMKQRVSFIRTLLTGAEVMLLDEPFSALDAITKISMQEWLLNQWSKFNKTILFITHDVEEALFLSNKIFVVSEKPINKLKEVIVPVGYPRDRHMLSRPEILSIKEELVNELKQRVEL
ncbi:ABC transporter ATP-binding protein [Clostridium aciditolerans]|uniref:ABC-type quaternary amine transporter n=1 Tax=Clostridium aciditolerans TaxID=339861 RepID=A0A934M299_9CLOT|nr:ABC transporter ATP-binding protein [Clostridium aciditolerans]MBI6871917.1 ABC transporter ATP-binding protein [Clostridium aciditolerans]